MGEDGARAVSPNDGKGRGTPADDVDALASSVGLTLDVADRELVRAQLARLVAAARLVMEFPLTDDLESTDVSAT
jgi:hypothetical protein